MTPTVFALLVALGGVLAPRNLLLPLTLTWCLFGGTAALSLPALGGATITPAVFFLPFLVVRGVLEHGGGQPFRRVSRAGFWLILLSAWGAASALLLPRLLAGSVQILSVDRGASSPEGPVLLDLRPVSGNVTQVGYALGGAACFLAVRALLSRPGDRERFRDGVLMLAALNVAAAVLNVGEYYLGFPPLLDSIRTASYAMFESHESAGLLRIQGTFPETSAFSAFTLPLFAFSASLWLDGDRPWASGAAAAASLSLLSLSTSGTAYAGLLAYLACAGVALAWRARGRRLVPRLRTLVAGGCLLGAAGASALVFELQVLRRLAEFLDATLLSKLESDSGVERGSWNSQAWSNFLDTYGLGTGLGSARASSYPLVLLSNVGVVGTLLFVAFVANTWRGSDGETRNQPIPRAARQALLAALIAASISGTVFDLGVAFYAFAAAASAGMLSSGLRTGAGAACRPSNTGGGASPFSRAYFARRSAAPSAPEARACPSAPALRR